MRTERNDPSLGPVRSALGLRLALAIFGLVASVVAVIAFAATSHPVWMVVFLVVAVIAAVDIGVIVLRIRQRRRLIEPNGVGRRRAGTG